jgi:DNA-directed RNA polymerase subunit RPC12/RpoP
MSSVRDIACPNCGRTDPVEKRTLSTYRCRACGTEFSPADVLQGSDSS